MTQSLQEKHGSIGDQTETPQACKTTGATLLQENHTTLPGTCSSCTVCVCVCVCVCVYVCVCVCVCVCKYLYDYPLLVRHLHVDIVKGVHAIIFVLAFAHRDILVSVR